MFLRVRERRKVARLGVHKGREYSGRQPMAER